MIVAIMKAVLKMISTINNLVVVLNFVILTLSINNSTLLFDITDAFLSLNHILYIHHLVRFKKNQAKI